MKTLLDVKWFFTEAHGYKLWGVSTSSNGLHLASKGRQFMRNTKLLMAKIILQQYQLLPLRQQHRPGFERVNPVVMILWVSGLAGVLWRWL